MRTLCILLFLFSAISCQSQIKTNFSKAPINPIPEKYTAVHWQFAGVPKKVIKISYEDTFVYHFTRDGRLTSIESPYYSKPSVYVYDKKGKLLQNRTYRKFDSSVINFNYNSKGQLCKTDYVAEKFAVNFYYDEKGLLCKETNTDGKERDLTYDSDNRLILEKEKNYSNTFVYTQHPTYLEVEKTMEGENYSATFLTYYDTYGNKIGIDNEEKKEPIIQLKIKRDLKGNLLNAVSIYTDKSKETYSYEYY